MKRRGEEEKTRRGDEARSLYAEFITCIGGMKRRGEEEKGDEAKERRREGNNYFAEM